MSCGVCKRVCSVRQTAEVVIEKIVGIPYSPARVGRVFHLERMARDGMVAVDEFVDELTDFWKYV